tara:strand:+ start:3981 stop:5285 length:1305 start_codon:yes stop_codon:yes gene_type:complete
MPVASSPSDYTTINPNYSTGKGFYTDISAVSDLLQVTPFTSGTNPSAAQVGSIIKRIEGMVDEKVNRSYRPIIWKNEFKDFEFTRSPIQSYYGGYVGFIQLSQMKIRKIVSLRVWEGNNYRELASAQGTISLLDNFRDIYSLTFQLPNGGISFELIAQNTISDLDNDEFCTTFGVKTTNDEITDLINEKFPSSTSQFTGATEPKELTSNSLNISDFFFAQKDDQDGTKVLISSLLSGDDGAGCVIKASIQQSCNTSNGSSNLTVADSSKLIVGMEVVGSGIPNNTTISSISGGTTVVLSKNATASASVTITFTTDSNIPTVCSIGVFTDKEDMKRLGDFWMISDDGRIFFMKKYPYHNKNSIIVSYVAGDGRVPSTIHEATTKLVAAEILRHDDQTIMIAETGANISAKEKYDLLRKEAMDLIDGKKDLVYILD